MDLSIKVLIVSLWTFILVLTALDISSLDTTSDINYNASKQALKNAMVSNVEDYKDVGVIDKDELINKAIVEYIKNSSNNIDLSRIEFFIVEGNPPIVLYKTSNIKESEYLDKPLVTEGYYGILIEEVKSEN